MSPSKTVAVLAPDRDLPEPRLPPAPCVFPTRVLRAGDEVRARPAESSGAVSQVSCLNFRSAACCSSSSALMCPPNCDSFHCRQGYRSAATFLLPSRCTESERLFNAWLFRRPLVARGGCLASSLRAPASRAGVLWVMAPVAPKPSIPSGPLRVRLASNLTFCALCLTLKSTELPAPQGAGLLLYLADLSIRNILRMAPKDML